MAVSNFERLTQIVPSPVTPLKGGPSADHFIRHPKTVMIQNSDEQISNGQKVVRCQMVRILNEICKRTIFVRFSNITVCTVLTGFGMFLDSKGSDTKSTLSYFIGPSSIGLTEAR